MNNPDVILNINTEGQYMCIKDYHYYCVDSKKTFSDRGLGALPSGLKNVSSHYIYASTDNFVANAEFPYEGVDVQMEFADTELCNTVATLLAGYTSDYLDKDRDGNFCNSNQLIKVFPVD